MRKSMLDSLIREFGDVKKIKNRGSQSTASFVAGDLFRSLTGND
jgi:hypothetical protein